MKILIFILEMFAFCCWATDYIAVEGTWLVCSSESEQIVAAKVCAAIRNKLGFVL